MAVKSHVRWLIPLAALLGASSYAGGPTPLDLYLPEAEVRLEDLQAPTERTFMGEHIITVPGFVLVAAPFSDDAATDAGDVFLYSLDANADPKFQFVKRMDRFGGAVAGAFQGIAMAGDRDTVAISQKNENIVVIYERNQGGANNWGISTTISAPEDTTYREVTFGGSTVEDQSVDIHGDLLIIGDYQGDRYTPSGSTVYEDRAGFVFIYARNEGGPNNWGLIQRIEDPTRVKTDTEDFGRAVAIYDGVDEDVAVVGAPNTDVDGQTINVGEAYVYRRTEGSTEWELIKTLVGVGSDGRQDEDAFGRTIDIDDKLMVIGTDIGGTEGDEELAGSVHFFYRDLGGPENWGEADEIFEGERIDGYSEEIQLSGDRLIVGSSGGGPGDGGAVYIYHRNEGGPDRWGLEQRLIGVDRSFRDQFGAGVALLDGFAIVGDRGRDSRDGEIARAGSMYIFFKDQLFSGAFGDE